MEGETSTLGLILAWLPSLVYLGIWVWGVFVFKRYAADRIESSARLNDTVMELVDSNKQLSLQLARWLTDDGKKKDER